jgi:putative aldouronate transport system substrate-binding protein
MKTKTRKLAMLLLVALMLISIVGCTTTTTTKSTTATTAKPTVTTTSGTTGKPSIVTAPGEFPVVTEPITLKVFAGQPAHIIDMATQEFTIWYEEQTGVRIEWEVTPSGEALEKANIVLSGGEYPDFFMNVPFSRIQAVLYGNSGVFVRLNELIDEHGLHIKAMFEESPYTRQTITDNDGNIYAFPNVEECYHCTASQKLWIYRPWLEALNMKMPTTTDEYTEFLKAVRDGDLNGNGNANDEVPLTGAITGAWQGNIVGFLMNPFVYNDFSYTMLENGKVKFVPDQDGWKEGLTYLKMLYDEKLIAPESFTQDAAQLKQLVENPDAPMLASVPAGHIGVFGTIYGETGRYMEFDAVLPLKGPTGLQQAAHFPYAAGMKLFVTSACEYPEVVTRWADWFFSFEGNVSAWMGIKDVHWEVPTGKKSYTGIDAIYGRIESLGTRTNPSSEGIQGTLPCFHPVRIREAEFRPMHASGYDNERKLWEETNRYYPFIRQEVLPVLFYTQQQAEEMSELKVAIDRYVMENSIQFITGAKNIATDWDTYKAEFNRLNVAAYIAIVQAAYDARPAK